ncbi:LysR family transcriptional regulator [Glaciimonas sp. Gout2]|uniref:LysR family transcriptional regulator n=1 Tax=unclassified Glaciimonas TaxID=2644401 RepID=UPI002B2329F2|nr:MULTISPECIES: LysR family transcriptional regulator [unclassified Glaciimonas]MEB0010689.1 LysR family transcriptional regulator [Glaciimonas sp. Cout2]MEB0082175.1 LysR family transcriptional regulator [Glaciimonas sp. Gout2]
MNLFESMKVFVKVADCGSLSAAARALDISNPSVTRHIADLEAYLHARLLNRTTRRISLTDTGTAYLERSRQLLFDLDEAETEASNSAANPSGILRINVPVSFSVNHLGRVLPLYAERYPNVVLDVSLSDRIVDLVDEGYDLAIRIGKLQGQSLVVRKIAPARVLLCAGPGYLAKNGTPQHPIDLENHVCLNYAYSTPRDEWRFLRDGKTIAVHVKGRLNTNNGDLLREAAIAGMGIIRQPSFIVGDDVRAGRLVMLLPEYHSETLSIYAAYPSRRHLSAKVRTFVDFLGEQFGDTPYWDLGLPHE